MYVIDVVGESALSRPLSEDDDDVAERCIDVVARIDLRNILFKVNSGFDLTVANARPRWNEGCSSDGENSCQADATHTKKR